MPWSIKVPPSALTSFVVTLRKAVETSDLHAQNLGALHQVTAAVEAAVVAAQQLITHLDADTPLLLSAQLDGHHNPGGQLEPRPRAFVNVSLHLTSEDGRALTGRVGDAPDITPPARVVAPRRLIHDLQDEDAPETADVPAPPSTSPAEPGESAGPPAATPSRRAKAPKE